MIDRYYTLYIHRICWRRSTKHVRFTEPLVFVFESLYGVDARVFSNTFDSLQRVVHRVLRRQGESSTVTDSETDNDFWTLSIHGLSTNGTKWRRRTIKPITSWFILIDAKSTNQTGSQR